MSKKIYDELVAAGAPALPEGYYYKISQNGIVDMVAIGIRKKHGIFFTEEFKRSYWFDEDFRYFHSRDDIAKWYADVIEKTYAGWRALNYQIDRYAMFESFLGKHP